MIQYFYHHEKEGFDTMKEHIRVGIIGCGSRGRMLTDTLLAFDDGDLIAVCDTYE
jgi:predicted dehydrogenase